MKCIISILTSLFLFSGVLQAQHRYDESFKKMKRELHLTKFQEKQVKKLDKEAEIKINRIARSGLTSKARIKQIEEERKNSIRRLLNPEQQERWQLILENKPRRGVTDMPNERTVKQ